MLNGEAPSALGNHVQSAGISSVTSTVRHQTVLLIALSTLTVEGLTVTFSEGSAKPRPRALLFWVPLWERYRLQHGLGWRREAEA